MPALQQGRSYRPVEDSFLTRREWLEKTGTGFGALALSTMLFEQGLKGKPVVAVRWLAITRTAKAKRVLNIFLAGAAPHMDLWDPRPELNSNNGKAVGNRKLLASRSISQNWPKRSANVRDMAEHRPARR